MVSGLRREPLRAHCATPGPPRHDHLPDYVGTSDELTDVLGARSGFQRIDEVVFAVPFSFHEADYAQIIADMATQLGARLGWGPARTSNVPIHSLARSRSRLAV